MMDFNENEEPTFSGESGDQGEELEDTRLTPEGDHFEKEIHTNGDHENENRIIENIDNKDNDGTGVDDDANKEVDGVGIWVAGLNYKANEDYLTKTFGEFGELASVRLIRDPHTNESKRYGFVSFTDKSFAEAAIEKLHNTKPPGFINKMTVELSKRSQGHKPGSIRPRQDSGPRGDSYRTRERHSSSTSLLRRPNRSSNTRDYNRNGRNQPYHDHGDRNKDRDRDRNRDSERERGVKEDHRQSRSSKDSSKSDKSQREGENTEGDPPYDKEKSSKEAPDLRDDRRSRDREKRGRGDKRLVDDDHIRTSSFSRGIKNRITDSRGLPLDYDITRKNSSSSKGDSSGSWIREGRVGPPRNIREVRDFRDLPPAIRGRDPREIDMYLRSGGDARILQPMGRPMYDVYMDGPPMFLPHHHHGMPPFGPPRRGGMPPYFEDPMGRHPEEFYDYNHPMHYGGREIRDRRYQEPPPMAPRNRSRRPSGDIRNRDLRLDISDRRDGDSRREPRSSRGDRGRSEEKEYRGRDSDKDKDRNRDKSRDKGESRNRHGDIDQERIRDRDRDRDRPRDRDRDRDEGARDGDRDRDRDRDRGRRRREQDERERTPPPLVKRKIKKKIVPDKKGVV